MENLEEVNKILSNLNSGNESKPWIVLDGYHSFPKVDFQDGKAIFYPATGLVVKVFVQSLTGEIRIFPANMFERI